MSLNHEIKSLNGVSQSTNITQRFPPPWIQNFQCLSSLCCSAGNTCAQTVRAKTGLFSTSAHTKPVNHTTSPIATHTEGWQRIRSRNYLPVPTGFKDRKATFLISKRKMSRLQTIASNREGRRGKHKMQLGVSLTIKLLHFIQTNPRWDQHTVCCSRKRFSRSPLVPFSAWTEMWALLCLLFLMSAWLLSNCSSNHHLLFFLFGKF